MNGIPAIISGFFIRLLPGTAGIKLFGIIPQKIAWIVHPRNIQDLEKEVPFLSRMPGFLRSSIILNLPPYKVSVFSESEQPRGYVIAVPLLPIHFYKNKRLSTFRVTQAFRLAKKMGAEKVSVGGMLSTTVEKNRLGKRFGIEVFDGTDLLAAIAAEKISRLIEERNPPVHSIGIIGATTKSGSRLSKYLASGSLDELHLFAKTAQNVQALAEECRKISQARIIEHTDLSAIGRCDLSVLTAFIPGVSIDIPKNLKRNSIFMSIIEPVSPFVLEIEKLRPDVHLMRGITIKAPNLSYEDFDSVIHSGNAFACLTEALVADREKKSSHPDNIEMLLKQNNFQIA